MICYDWSSPFGFSCGCLNVPSLVSDCDGHGPVVQDVVLTFVEKRWLPVVGFVHVFSLVWFYWISWPDWYWSDLIMIKFDSPGPKMKACYQTLSSKNRLKLAELRETECVQCQSCLARHRLTPPNITQNWKPQKPSITKSAKEIVVFLMDDINETPLEPWFWRLSSASENGRGSFSWPTDRGRPTSALSSNIQRLFGVWTKLEHVIIEIHRDTVSCIVSITGAPFGIKQIGRLTTRFLRFLEHEVYQNALCSFSDETWQNKKAHVYFSTHAQTDVWMFPRLTTKRAPSLRWGAIERPGFNVEVLSACEHADWSFRLWRRSCVNDKHVLHMSQTKSCKCLAQSEFVRCVNITAM